MTTRRVLIVEDEMVVQLHLTRIVGQLGHDVIGAAADMTEALAIARRAPPDLVLTDIRLDNDSDGVETARALVDEFDCVVVFISAYADDATLERSRTVGAAGYLVKPFTVPQVRAAITTAFASHARRAGTRARDRERERERDPVPVIQGRDPVDAGWAIENRPFGAGTRLLVYSHDTFGLGHIRRCLALIRTLSARFPGISMLLVTGSPMMHRYSMPAGADYVKLPALQKVGAETYEARSLQIPGPDILALRSKLILNAVHEYQPNVLLVDHSPAGGDGELRPTLDWLAERGDCTRILGLRDIVDDPDTVRATWSQREIYGTLNEHYDHIAIYGDRKVFDPIEAYELPPEVAAKATFVGYVCAGAIDAGLAASWTGPSTGSSAGVPADPRPLVFVTIGGGDGGGEAILVPFLQMMQQYGEAIEFRAEIVTGPFVDPGLRDRLGELSTGLPVVMHEFLPSTRGLMERAELVISTAGYNTTTDVLSWARRSILIPRVLFRQEQAMRARRLGELGLCTCLHPDDVSPTRLFETIQSALRDVPLPRARASGLPLNGAARFADFCATMQVAVRARRRGVRPV